MNTCDMLDPQPQKGTEQMCESRTKHRQVVANPQPLYQGPIYPGVTTVDEALHPLMQALWAQGFETQASCEGGLPDLTLGYILFRHVHDGIRFFRDTHLKMAAQGRVTPLIALETARGLTEDGVIDLTIAPRGTVRFRHEDLKTLEAAWLS